MGREGEGGRGLEGKGRERRERGGVGEGQTMSVVGQCLPALPGAGHVGHEYSRRAGHAHSGGNPPPRMNIHNRFLFPCSRNLTVLMPPLPPCPLQCLLFLLPVLLSVCLF